MYRPSMYDKHDETMYAFAEKFNSSDVCRDVVMKPNDEETFGNDGYFVCDNGQKIGYDWEYRDKYFSNCKLKFDTLGQYERKLKKDCIQIALQCDSTETGIAVGWHEDWLVEAKEGRRLSTDFEMKECADIRYTDKYKIYSYEEINAFKYMISEALRLHTYSYKIYKMMSDIKAAEIINCLGDYVENNILCKECGKKLELVRNSRGICYLKGKECTHVEYLTPDQVNRYIAYYKKLCPIHGCSISSGVSKYGVYVRCEQGHFMKPDEI